MSERICLVMEMRLDGRLPMPKHMSAHLPHDWWYTSYGDGHQMVFEPPVGDPDYSRSKRWHCPGYEA